MTISLKGLTAFSQDPTTPELIFINPQLRTGPGTHPDGADGAVYIFQNVTAGVDALVSITGRSSTEVTLSTIDLAGPNQDPVNGTGFDNAWQPRVAYNHGNAGAGLNWWMEFQVSFVQHDDNSKPVSVSQFFASGLDIDGDGANLNEFLSFFGLQSYTLEQNTVMTVTPVTGSLADPSAAGETFDGPTKNYPGISTSATDDMVTNYYSNTNSFSIRSGAASGGSATNAADRMYSVWFKTFTYNIPQITTLPLSLSSFTAQWHTQSVRLDWVSEIPAGTSHYIVQRSVDGSSFDDDAVVMADESSVLKKEYQFADDIRALKSPLIFYRLRMVGTDGSAMYSEILLVRQEAGEQSGLLVFPNPASHELRVTIPNGWQGRQVSYNIFSSSGNLMKQKISGSAGQTEIMPIVDLPPGIYLLNVMNGNQQTVQKFVKTNY
jgi:hypothetical protein